MKKLGLIGQDISYSLSKKLHQNIASMYHLDVSYEIFDVKEQSLQTLFDQMRQGKYDGFNITKPYKEKVIPFLDELTDQAKRIGAVNTVFKNQNKMIGHNTDYDGFIGLIQWFNISFENKNIYILGSGGAARACYVALTDLGFDPVIVSRTPYKKHPLFKKMITYESLRPKANDICINATPLGMGSYKTYSPLTFNQKKELTVIDLNYRPLVTKFMEGAKQGYQGLYMFFIQGIKSEMLWHQRPLDISVETLKSLKEVLKNE